MPKYTIGTWQKAHDLAKKARDKSYGFMLDSSTRVRVSHDKHGYRGHETVEPDKAIYAVVHFSTEVLYFYPNGDFGINLHGWNSITTKRRIVDHTNRCRVRSNHGVQWLYAYRAAVPMEDGKEYIARGSILYDPSGAAIGETIKSALPRPLSKSRDTLKKPLPGDLLRAPDGTHWLVARDGRDGAVQLYEFRGDLPAHRAYSSVGERRIDLNPLFLLTADGWKAVARFDLMKEVSLDA